MTAKHHRLELVYRVFFDKHKDDDDLTIQIALRQFEEFVKPEEARRTKRIEGNKYDERSLLGELRAKIGYDKIWTEQEARTTIDSPLMSIFHLLKKIPPGQLKKGEPSAFADFVEKRGTLGRAGCRIFYQLIRPVQEVTEIARERLRREGES